MSRTDGKGGLAGVYHGSQTPFAGEAAPRQLEIGEVQREGSDLTFPFEETRFPEDSPDGCTYSYTGIYAFEDDAVFEFLAGSPPAEGAQGVGTQDLNLEKVEGGYLLTGRFTGWDGGNSASVMMEASGVERTYAFAPFIPGPDGSFSVFIAFEPPKGTFMITNIVVNGVTKAHSQGDAK